MNLGQFFPVVILLCDELPCYDSHSGGLSGPAKTHYPDAFLFLLFAAVEPAGLLLGFFAAGAAPRLCFSAR